MSKLKLTSKLFKKTADQLFKKGIENKQLGKYIYINKAKPTSTIINAASGIAVKAPIIAIATANSLTTFNGLILLPLIFVLMSEACLF